MENLVTLSNNLNAKDKEGQTAFHMACGFGHHMYCTLYSVNEGITQESPMGNFWVIPRKVDKMV